MSIRWHAKKFHLQKPLILYFTQVGNRNQGTFILFSSFFVAIFFYLLPSVVFAAFCTFSSSANDQQNRSKEKKFSRWLVACAIWWWQRTKELFHTALALPPPNFCPRVRYHRRMTRLRRDLGRCVGASAPDTHSVAVCACNRRVPYVVKGDRGQS